MKILFVNNQSIKEAIRVLHSGGTVVFPTETAYGLAADVANKKAIKKVLQIKQRPAEKSLPWIVSSVAMAKKYVKFSPLANKLAKKYWPGPLTIVLPKKRGKDTVAVRVSSNRVARALARGLGRPIVSTSANVSGAPTCYRATAVMRQFRQQKLQPDMILNVGRLSKHTLSTIIKIEGKKIIILRRGAVRI